MHGLHQVAQKTRSVAPRRVLPAGGAGASSTRRSTVSPVALMTGSGAPALTSSPTAPVVAAPVPPAKSSSPASVAPAKATCLLYTSDAADERSSVDLGGRRI